MADSRDRPANLGRNKDPNPSKTLEPGQPQADTRKGDKPSLRILLIGALWWLGGGCLQRGHCVDCHCLDIDALQRTQRQFVSLEKHFATDFDARLASLSEVPIGEIAKEGDVGACSSGCA